MKMHTKTLIKAPTKILTRILFSTLISIPFFAYADSKTKLALNWKPEPQFGGFYAAELNQYYQKHKLNIEVVPGGSGTPVVQMVASGTLDYGIVSADELIVARSRGAKVVALFATYQTNPQGIMTHAEKSYKSIEDVYKNKGTLALQAGLPYAQFFQKKYAPYQVTLVPYLGGIANFVSDKNYSQQCFVTSEPLLAKKQNLNVKTFLIAEAGFNPYTTVLITREDVIARRKAEVTSVVQAVREGWKEYLAHPEATNKMMAGLNPSMDLGTFKDSAEAQKSLIETADTQKSGLGSMTEKRWKDLIQQLLDLKLIPKIMDEKSVFVNL